MYHAIFVSPWPWWVAGPTLGLVVVLTAWLGGKGLGVSTAYGSVCAAASRLPFFRQRQFHEPWRVWFVAGLPLGGLAAAALGGWFAPGLAYGSLDALTGGSLAARAGLLCGGGLLVGAGARWAGGCPSGHGLVGIGQGPVASLAATGGLKVAGRAASHLLHAGSEEQSGG